MTLRFFWTPLIGHTLQENLGMEADSKKTRASFMCKASMLWQLSSKYAESYFKAWNMQSRLAWNFPHETHTDLIENYFCEGHLSLRQQVLIRYNKFVRKLTESPSKEIRFLINLVK